MTSPNTGRTCPRPTGTLTLGSHQARPEIGQYLQADHHRPHSGLGYRTAAEVATTWQDPDVLHTTAT